MSIVLIRSALEVGLNGIPPAIETAWENVKFTPSASGTPYQVVRLLPSQQENPSLGAAMYRASGIMQVLLCYPLAAGPQAAASRADLIVSRFRRGNSYTATDGTSTIRVLIDLTPSVGPALEERDRYCLPVSIPYVSHVFVT